MSVQSWFDREVSDVAGLLAEEHVARTLLKQADLASSLRDIGGQFQGLASNAGKQFSEFGQNFGPQAQALGGKAMEWLTDPNHQAARQGLVGAGVGGLLGAGSQLFRDPEERQYGSSAMTGALAGGALGGGLGLIQQNMGNASPRGGESGPAAGAGAGAGAGSGAGVDSTEAQIAALNKKMEQFESEAGKASPNYFSSPSDYGWYKRLTGRSGVDGEDGKPAPLDPSQMPDANPSIAAKSLLYGGAAAGATAGGGYVAKNLPDAAIPRGVDSLDANDTELLAAVKRLRKSPKDLSFAELTRAGLSSYLDPRLPGFETRFEDVSVPPGATTDNPLDEMTANIPLKQRQTPTQPSGPTWRPQAEDDPIFGRPDSGSLSRQPVGTTPIGRPNTDFDSGPRVGTTASNAAMDLGPPGTTRKPVTRFQSGLFANPAAPNKQIPGLTNEQVRALWRRGSRGNRLPSRAGLYTAGAVGLLPLIVQLAQASSLDNAQRQLAKTLHGGKN